MERVEIRTTLTQADWQAYQAHFAQRTFGNGRHRIVGMMLGAAIVVAGLVLADYFDQSFSILGVIAGVLLGTVGSFYNAFQAKRAARPDPEGSFLGPCTLVLSATGIETVKPGSHGHIAWSLVQETTLTSQHMFVWVDRIAAIIVPLRDLPAALEPGQLAETIETFRNSCTQPATESQSVVPAQAPHVEPITPQSSIGFRQFMRTYVRLLFGRTPAARDLAISRKFVSILLAVSLAGWLLYDRWSAGSDATFYPNALFVWCWYLVVLLATTLAASRLAQPHVAFDRMLTFTTAFVPIAIALQIAAVQWLGWAWQWLASMAIAIYGVVYLARVLRSLTLLFQPRAVGSVLLILCAAVWISHSLYFGAGFWYADEEGSDGPGYWEQMKASESLLFSQPARIDSAVRALQRPEQVPAAAFFVGFAGMGEQRVFAGEIALARKVIADKFDSGQRSVLLVNDQRDLETLPLASPTALRYTLKQIAARMDVESDVLFLAVSSHGSSEGELSVSNGMLSLNSLSTTDLAAALRESGIKWKVVVVSACYAGKFIEPLRDDNTIVITAAAEDRTSFGCSDDRDLTYFGEAFYRDALPGASNLQSAFAEASASIAAREKSEGKKASNPQAHFGPALVEHLELAFQRERT